MIGAFGFSLTVTIVLGSLTIVGAIVCVYLYALSKLREGTNNLQDQANSAQQQIIEVMQLDLNSLRITIEKQATTIEHQSTELTTLRTLVTQAAKVDNLRDSIETFHSVVMGKFDGLREDLAAHEVADSTIQHEISGALSQILVKVSD